MKGPVVKELAEEEEENNDKIRGRKSSRTAGAL